MRTSVHVLLALTVVVPLVVAASPAESDPCAGVLCAGAASVDATWHTGAGQGQLGGAGNHLSDNDFDPFHHSTKMVPSDGIQSRTFAKAVVLQGPDGSRAAYVKTDVYLQQDILSRRVADLVSGADPTSPYVVEGLDASRIMLGGTHNHSVPHYTSTAWGVWIFADAFDFRAFDHTATRIAASIERAADSLRPAEVGAAVLSYDDIQQNILGPSTADDGTPAGMPRDHFDSELAVLRFDEAGTGEPIGAIVNLGMHPESIGGNANLISSDFTGVVERIVERQLGKAPGGEHGPVVAWSQGGLGDVEPDRSRANHPDEAREYWRRDFAQAERMSRELADAVLAGWVAAREGPDAAVELGHGPVAGKHMPMTTQAPVEMVAYRFPGPATHPVPTVSNCRTDHPGAPILGFPDCVRGGDPPGWGATIERLEAAGVPVPENYGAPAYGAVHEGLTIHLQALRVGDVLLATCPCEPLTDMTLNLKTRVDDRPGNIHVGYLPECEDRDDGQVWCAFPGNAWQQPEWRPVDREAHERMIAQITHDAVGWETDPAHLGGEAEPSDPAEIKGNFTHDEMGSDDGFAIPLMVGTANDYVGYVVSYREYQRGDHYRKALTPFGPRTSDYINSRLVAMARELRGGPSPQDARDVAQATFEELVQTGKVRVVGHGSDAFTSAYELAIPDDGGTPGHVVEQPAAEVDRFDAATFTWQGGSNYTDNPTVVVQQLVQDDADHVTVALDDVMVTEAPDGWPVPTPPLGTTETAVAELRAVDEDVPVRWETVATQEGGEVVLTLAYDDWTSDAPLAWLAGDHTYEWTATFETTEQVPPGVYRFLVRGHHRSGRSAQPYEANSAPFEVDVWRGLTVEDLTLDHRSVSFGIRGEEATTEPTQIPGPISIASDEVRYPFTYDTDLDFIGHAIFERGTWRYCFRCTFRPWATHGPVVEAAVTVTRADGRTLVRDAGFDETSGRWTARGINLKPGDTVSIEPGQIRDALGNTNDGRYVLGG